MKRVTLFLAAVLVLAAAAFTSQTTTPVVSGQKKEKIRKKARPVPNNYIVVLNEWAAQPYGDSSFVPNVAADMASAHNGKVKRLYRHALLGFSVEMSAEQAERLADDPRVEYVEEDGVVSISATQSNPPWGLDRIDQRDRPLNSAYNYTPTGSGVRAYIIDTGIRRTHQDFGGRAFAGYDAIGDGQNSNDCNGHGTHVAGTVGGSTYGVAKGVSLYAVRVLNCTGNGTDSGVIAGVDWVRQNRVLPAVANMSLGGGASSALDTAVNNLINSGVTVVVAAGNDYGANACNYSPARVANAVTVGSTTSSDARSDFSNIGTCLDIFAPGSSVQSAWYTSDTATNTISGTSMASPHVAGVAALYLQNNTGATPSTVASQIINTASTGKLTGIGTGSPNRLLYSLLTTDGGGGGGAPCTGCTQYTGSLSGTGSSQYQPNGSYYYSSVSGYHRGWLRGPTSGADFDLYLQKWNGSSWVIVARGETATSNEDISYYGTAGYYRWHVYSYSGSGSYSLWLQNP
ncbi:MAG TPA: S8 family peptidase [Pyrinomonadaceae bacterium]|nr:S8 family peptidase [Pyrinomonadaceae bacterium]